MNKMEKFIVYAVAVLAVLGIFVIQFNQYNEIIVLKNGISNISSAPKFNDTVIQSNTLQAVFLTNGQVYFGKLSIENSKYFKLSDAFYSKEGGAITNTENITSAPHQPQSSMFIPAAQILFWENLSANSPILRSR